MTNYFITKLSHFITEALASSQTLLELLSNFMFVYRWDGGLWLACVCVPVWEELTLWQGRELISSQVQIP